MSIGELIIKYRTDHGLSQRAFANKCGDVTNGYISMIENGENPTTKKPLRLSLDKLYSLARGMDMSLTDLLEQLPDQRVILRPDDTPLDYSAAELSEQEDEILSLFRRLNQDGKETLLKTARGLAALSDMCLRPTEKVG